MRAIDADALQLAIVEEGQANKRKKYIIGDIWELTGAEIRKVINSQPTIHPEPHWIPVTQDTPTEDDDYWATFEAGTGRFVDWASWYQGRWVTWIEGSPAPLSNVIAWQKSPEPYKGVTDGRD